MLENMLLAAGDPIDPLLTSGVDPNAASISPGSATGHGPVGSFVPIMWGLLSTVSAAVSGYHGLKRHHGSIGWGLAWFALGGMFPILVPTIGFAQGYGKPMARS